MILIVYSPSRRKHSTKWLPLTLVLYCYWLKAVFALPMNFTVDLLSLESEVLVSSGDADPSRASYSFPSDACWRSLEEGIWERMDYEAGPFARVLSGHLWMLTL